ncbi:alcohol-forming fatty acyl-CoA reductase-like [Dioscorea cayenensis subsp. rotundata]|uniref:Fatty acyl-CoA reductase n=1 Tax=Dioscorea cayennensis subsp. rotundata TaxID=55577 RepID=A0AB40AWW3_DIOCR|nr:alcohol-forming fatty acyl-CoA reductase-like [Dioscorea cayenensis subsp. rotundata]
MEMSVAVKSLDSKSILVTGATGFLAKLFVEKVLRTQPNVKKLYLLVRAHDAISAKTRVEKEVLSKELFNVLREKYGASFDSFFWSKVHVVQGDTTSENIGIRDVDLIEVLWREVDYIVNSAANTRFNERYDVALNANTNGPRNVILFAKKCVNLEMFLHVSTAYVTKEKKGIISEKIDEFNQMLTPETEMELIESKMKEMKNNCISESEIKIYMKELGLERANKYGWPNTYSFTKAMGELQITKYKGNLPVTILRPTIILSTYKEPFPGWIEGIRTIDKAMVSYGKAGILYFPAHLDAVIDVIPGDMVVNAMLAAMISRNYGTYDTKYSNTVIYHVGSSAKNIMRFNVIPETCYKYFSMNPQSKKNGEFIAVQKPFFFPTLSLFCKFMFVRYKLPLKALSLVAMISFSKRLRDSPISSNQAYKSAILMAKSVQPL